MTRCVVLATAWLGLLPGRSAAQIEAEREARGLAVIRQGISGAVGHADTDIDLTQRAGQFWVRIINSPLNARTGV